MSDVKDPRFVSSMFPLKATQGTIGFDSIRRDELRKIINSHLKMLLLTNPGEIISDSKFGVGILSYLFLLENEPKLLNLKSAVEAQIREYLPYLLNFRVFVDRRKVMEHKIAVRIVYSITDDLSTDTVDFIVSEGTTDVITSEAGGSVTLTLGEILDERV